MDTQISPELLSRVAAAFPMVMEAVADGRALETAAKAHNLSRAAIRRYMAVSPEARAEFELARTQQTEALMDELMEVQASTTIDPRLQANRIKALTWMIEKRDPQRYGQRSSVDLNVKGQIDLTRALADSDKREQDLLARRAALALPAAVVVNSPVPAESDAVWAELVG